MSELPYNSILHHSTDQASGKKRYHIKPVTVYDFLNTSNRHIEIPKYQRPYSWGEHHVISLLDDINNLDAEDSWFLGPLFVVKHSSGEDDIQLLDGQQRTTTIVLLLLEIYKQIILYKSKFGQAIEESDQTELKSKYEQLLDQLSSIHQALTVNNQGDRESRFKAEESMQDIFSPHVVAWVKERNNNNKYDELFEDLEKKCKTLSLSGIPTALKLYKNINTINDYFTKTTLNIHSESLSLPLNNDYDDADRLLLFTHKLLYRLWLLEIPLGEEMSSIKIFESLNNRGKPLSLIDKFRYRTLIDSSVYNQPNRIKSIRKKWKHIYMLFAASNEDPESFFAYYFMSKTGDEISTSSHDVFFKIFEKEYSGTIEKIDLFLEETTYFLEFLKACAKNDTALTDFVKVENLTNVQELKINGLFELSKRAMNFTKASKLLFFKMLRECKADSWSLFIVMFKINRHVFWTNFHNQTPANQLRSNYQEICKQSSAINSQLGSRDRPEKLFDLANKIILNQNAPCHFLLVFFTYLTESRFLKEWSGNQVDKSQCEHLMPRAWMAEWRNAENYTPEDAGELLEKLIKEKKYIHLDLLGLKDYVLREGVEFSPKEYSTIHYSKTQTIIEYLGNRWILSLPANVAGSNKNLEFKKEKFSDAGVTYPSPDSVIGMNKYEEWTSKEILERSFEIIDKLYESLSGNKPWDSFD